MFLLILGPIKVQVDMSNDQVTGNLSLNVETPWGNGGFRTGFDRSDVIKMCLVCGKLPRSCECDHPLLVNPNEVTEHLLELDHLMHHHMTGTECSDDEDE